MANGEALTKRYEVYDAETGERVEGNAWVLRPDEDDVAKSCVSGYAALCGMDDAKLRRMVTDGKHRLRKSLLDHVRGIRDATLAVRPGAMLTAPNLWRDFKDHKDVGHGADGTLEWAEKLWAEIVGYEPVYIMCRKTEESARKDKESDIRSLPYEVSNWRQWLEEALEKGDAEHAERLRSGLAKFEGEYRKWYPDERAIELATEEHRRLQSDEWNPGTRLAKEHTKAAVERWRKSDPVGSAS